MMKSSMPPTDRNPAIGQGQTKGKEEPHPVDRHVGQQIRFWRVRARISQGDLGAEIGVTFQQVQKYENAKNRVSASMLFEIAMCLKVPVSTFFEGLSVPGVFPALEDTPNLKPTIEYLSSAEGRRLFEGFIQLSPNVMRRIVALVDALADQ